MCPDVDRAPCFTNLSNDVQRQSSDSCHIHGLIYGVQTFTFRTDTTLSISCTVCWLKSCVMLRPKKQFWKRIRIPMHLLSITKTANNIKHANGKNIMCALSRRHIQSDRHTQTKCNPFYSLSDMWPVETVDEGKASPITRAQMRLM